MIADFVGDAGDDEDEEMKGPGLLCGAAWRKLRAAGCGKVGGIYILCLDWLRNSMDPFLLDRP